MLGIFKDSLLTLAVALATPKRFLLPLKGGSSSSSLWIGDPYACIVTAQVNPGATSIPLDQTFELPVPGLLSTGIETVLYTGKTATTVTGIPASGAGSVSNTYAAGSKFRPKLVYAWGSSLRVDPQGIDQNSDISLQLKRSDQPSFNFPNTPALYAQTTATPSTGLALNALELDVQVNVLPGAQQEFLGLSLVANSAVTCENLFKSSEQVGDTIWTKETGVTVVADAQPAPLSPSLSNADQISTTSANTGIIQDTGVAAVNGTKAVFSVWLKAASGTNVTLLMDRGAGLDPVSSSVAVTTSWAQYSVTHTGVFSGTTTLRGVLRLQSTGVNVFVWGMQFNRGSVGHPYTATTTLPQPGRVDIVTLQAPLYVFRRDQAFPQAMRLLPADRQVSSNLPGFVLGDYRWRDQDTVNGSVIVPTEWDQDPIALGVEKFAFGFGHGEDIAPLGLIERNDSIYMQVNHGSYFTGPFRHYLPAGRQIEFFPVTAAGPMTFGLAASPISQSPVFVGTWKMDSLGFYENDTEYRYMPDGLSAAGDAPPFQFALSRKARQITINAPPPAKILYLGTISGRQTDYFDMPLYPVDRVDRIYIDRGLAALPVDSTNWLFDRDQGTIQVINPTSPATGPSIPGALAGEAVFAQIQPAVAVNYETDAGGIVTVDTVDLNPAFSGLSSGHFYLQHRRQKPDTIQLVADKPVLAIPATHDTVIGLTAYGPVYFDGDYAMLIARAFSKVPGETVPNVRMRTIIDPVSFTGLLNYRNPVAQITSALRSGGVALYFASNGFQAGDAVTISGMSDPTFNGVFKVAGTAPTFFSVELSQPDATLSNQSGFAVIDINVVTGGDGTANLVYIPQPGYGLYLPTSAAAGPLSTTSLGGVKTQAITNDSLVFQTPIPLSQLWNAKEGWLVTVYSVLNNDPLFGIAGGNPSLGQVPFATVGTPGTVGYRTNGARSMWANGAAPILPIEARDINGVGHLTGGFTGSVKYLQFGQALPVPTGLAAYFVTFIQRITIQLQAIGSNVFSTPLLLQMAVPDVIIQNPWLVIEDDIQGRINQFRLGWVKPTPIGPTR